MDNIEPKNYVPAPTPPAWPSGVKLPDVARRLTFVKSDGQTNRGLIADADDRGVIEVSVEGFIQLAEDAGAWRAES